MVMAFPRPSVEAEAALKVGAPEPDLTMEKVTVWPLTGLPVLSVTVAVIMLL